MRILRIRRTMLESTALTGLVALVSIVAIFPYYTMIMMSTHSSAGIFQENVLIPGGGFALNIAKVWASNILRYYWNSISVSTVATILSVLVSSMAGFGLAKYDFTGKGLIRSLVLVTLLIPAQLGLIGYVKEMVFLGLTGTMWPLILIWTANPFGVFWMMSYMKENLPDEILDSARIDGCKDLRIYTLIVVPLIMPAIVTLAMLVFLWSWNLYLLPLIVINDPAKFTIPLSINMLDPSMSSIDYGARITALALSTLPLVLIFAVGSKYFIQGLTSGAVKG